jgi:hypothetical protein
MVLANLVYYSTRMLSVHRVTIAGVSSFTKVLDVVAGSILLNVVGVSRSVVFCPGDCCMVSFTNCGYC